MLFSISSGHLVQERGVTQLGALRKPSVEAENIPVAEEVSCVEVYKTYQIFH